MSALLSNEDRIPRRVRQGTFVCLLCRLFSVPVSVAQPFQTLSFENQVRLLNLKRWCQRYHVGLHWILSRLYEHYDRQRWAFALCRSARRRCRRRGTRTV